MSSGNCDKPTDRIKRAKSEISHNRISTETLRTEFRARFFNRLRSSRSKSVDRFRQILEECEDNIEYRSISDVRKALLQNKEASNLLQTEEVSDLLNLVEQELEEFRLNTEGEEYIKTMEKETEDVVNRLLCECQMCGTLTVENSICSSCRDEISTAFQ